MDEKKLMATAKKLHNTWLKENKVFVNACKNDPAQNNCSRDFTRAMPWEKLPEVWISYYKREAKIKLLCNF